VKSYSRISSGTGERVVRLEGERGRVSLRATASAGAALDRSPQLDDASGRLIITRDRLDDASVHSISTGARGATRGTAVAVPDVSAGTRGSRGDDSLVGPEWVRALPVYFIGLHSEFGHSNSCGRDHDIEPEVTSVCTAITPTEGWRD